MVIPFVRVVARTPVRFATTYTSGIEHANNMKKTGKQHAQSWVNYKVGEYYKSEKWTYYDCEKSMAKFRSAQPDSSKPDTERKVVQPKENEKNT